MFSILYEDQYIFCINKPAGTLVIPTYRAEKNTLTSQLNQMLAKRGESARAHPCHRLDKDTSGVILYAKGKKNQKRFMTLFHEKKITKHYLAVSNGKIENQEGVIERPIDGKNAVTEYHVINKNDDYTLCEINLHTGRTNQIRIHFKSIGHPLLGDYKYAFRRDFKIKMKRTALHAWHLQFVHPINGETISIVAPIPADLEPFIDKSKLTSRWVECGH